MARPGVRIPAVTLYAEKDQVESAFKKLSKAWICHKCQKTFNLLDSFGSLECRQHPGYVQEDGRWSCCGQKQLPSKWSTNWQLQRMFDNSGSGKNFRMPYNEIPPVRGCQKCDHNTNDDAFTHKDAMQISDLSALLPHINRRFPFHLRDGFDNGVLRRCAKRKIVVPPNAAKVVYLDNDGEKQEYDPCENNIPEGMELYAEDAYGDRILEWH